MIIDFHQHFYPNALASRVLTQLSRASGLTPLTDGTLEGTRAKNRDWGVDRAVLGKHMNSDNGIDPEGLLSTLPAIANTLLGFLVGKILASGDFRKMDSLGTALLVAGLLLAYLLPLNKKVWSPSFVLVVCGLGTLLLSLLQYIIDERGWWKHTGFFKVFGTNAIYCYLVSDVLYWLFYPTGFNPWVMGLIGVNRWTSLLFAVCSLLGVYLVALPLYKRKIFLKL